MSGHVTRESDLGEVTLPSAVISLTSRELEVLRLLARGLTNPVIAQRLSVSVHTVKFHLGSIYRKLGVSNRTEAAAAILLAGLLEVDGSRAGATATPEALAAADAPPEQCLHELVEGQVARTPESAALTFGEERLTYEELNARSNRLARFLRRQGVVPDDPVVLFLERSLDLPIAVLAVAKAGGAYLPVDPAYPEERVRSMLEQSRARALLTNARLRPRIPEVDGLIVDLGECADEIDRESPDDPEPAATYDNLAYVLFTSGSTGQPKGVAMPHRPLVNLMAWQLRHWTPPAAARTLQFASMSFDVASQEIWSTWAAGGLLVGIDEQRRRDPEALLAFLDEQRIERLFVPFVALQQLAEASGRLDLVPSALRDVFAAGEALQITPEIRGLFTRLPGCTLHNHYGPTESHVVTALTLEGPVDEWPDLPTIGRPITHARIYLLDGAGEQVSDGMPGEVFIGGPVLSRGYLNRPELTAERFVPDPYGGEPGAVMYRTGDLGSRRADGTIEYHGRADTQVKISGYRVELAEVEAALTRHPAVIAAVATAHTVRVGETRLIGYVTQGEQRVRGDDLRTFIGASLPAFMVPAQIVTLDSLPLTPSGKIDRKALPAPSGERDVDADQLVGARTDLERRLVRIWEDVLGVRPIGVTDDFFDLGASSLTAARLFARIQRELGARLPLGPIYQAPTIERLAELIQHGDREGQWTSLVPMQPLGSKPPLFCVHGGAGTILHLQPLARRLGTDQPFYGLQAQGLYGDLPPLQTVEEMSEHYLAELRNVQPEGPFYLAGYCFGAIIAFDMAQRLRAEGEQVATLVMFNGPSPTWLRTYGTIQGQPSRRRPEKTTAQRVGGTLTDPRKLAHLSRYYLRRTWWRVRGKANRRLFELSVRLGRPLPEMLRDDQFLRLHSIADRAYEPAYYPGKIVMYHGDGLYDDPKLGWDGLAASIESHAVPGVNTNNREAMAEPKVGFIAEHLAGHLAAARGE